MSNEVIFKNIIHKYELDSPIPETIQAFMVKLKWTILARILKALGIYSIFYGLILKVFFGLKKLGIGLSINQAIAVTVIASSVAAAGVGTGGYFAVKEIIMEQDTIIEVTPGDTRFEEGQNDGPVKEEPQFMERGRKRSPDQESGKKTPKKKTLKEKKAREKENVKDKDNIFNAVPSF